jgi:alginate O-acetyltransferase complex protein AlgI
LLPILALASRGRVPAWAFMWTMAAALYASCKWLTYRHADDRIHARPWRRVAYLVAWPGMDATAFLNGRFAEAGRAIEWFSALAKTTFGIVLLWMVAPLLLARNQWLAGWIAMAGVVFVLHFGVFHLLSLAWRRAAVDAKPIMRNPLRSTSLAEFWGRRWNIAFHELASRFTFTPLRRWVGIRAASVAVFIVSGLVHELVITLPARGGYGLPTLYFLLQAAGLVTERSVLGRRLGLGHGARGWIFAAVTAAAPAVLLFPPPFIHRVVVPMLGAIGAS